MSDVVTGLAATCGKKWPSPWRRPCGLDLACRRLSRPTLCFVPFIIGYSSASERTSRHAVRSEADRSRGTFECESRIG